MLKYNIRDTILKENLLEKEPYIYPMSAIRDEEIFQYFLDKYLIDPLVIVEIGTYMGVSTTLLSKYCNRCYTYDIRDYPEKYEIWKEFKCKNIKFNKIYDDEHKKKLIHKIPYINFAFIDGRHHGGVDVDYNILKDRCKQFLFHDYKPSIAIKNGKSLYDYVYTFIESIKNKAKVVDIKEPFVYMEFE